MDTLAGVVSPRRAKRLAGLPERAVWSRLLKRLERLDRDWADPECRRAALQDARALAEQACASAAALPPGLGDLQRRLSAELSQRQLLDLIVPLERALDRKRRDEDFLPVTDAPARIAAPMPVRVVADSLRSAFNVGGVFRTSECFGAQEILLTGYSADPEDPRVARAAMGTQRTVPWRRFRNALEAIACLRREGVAILALETGDGSVPLREVPARFPCAVLLGSERFGLAPETLAAADRRARIPTAGTKASLNVVAALAIALDALRDRFEATSMIR